MTAHEILKHCRLFENLSDEEIDIVASKVEEHHYRKGDYICREGAWGDSMFIIGSGEMKIVKKLDTENVWDITSLRHGDFFGEVALIDGSPRTASAVAIVNSVVLELYGRDFKELISGRDVLANKMLESLLNVLINRIRATDDVVTRIMSEKLKGETGQAGNMRDVMMRMMLSHR
ncbi:MAG TPA: cyclic nucleotide-binding domain-containing protein [bacterium]|nr:cyclic nucleotide-binding domain-containing protein [bacterium]